MNTLLNKIEVLILTTPTGENRNTLSEIGIILQTQLNLCDTCRFKMPSCGSQVTFGMGRGQDNIVKCDKYQYNS